MSGRAWSSLHITELRRRVKGRRGPNGWRLCNWCQGEVQKPRICWCSDACVEAYYIQARPDSFRHAVWKRDQGICAICRVDASKNKPDNTWTSHTWEADHVVPVCEGGHDTLANARTLCTPCHKKTTAEMRRRQAQAKRTAIQPALF